jgi:predicted RNA-binding Zn-ribbon protein involved in translation (DUF1610 family)
MAATNLPENTMPSIELNLQNLLADIARDYPDLQFIESARFAWHPGKRQVSYSRKTSSNTMHDIFALLHELGHAILEHKDYIRDIELLKLEVTAWQKAKQLANHYGITLEPDYVEDCLDTYRDWLHLRATCPSCYVRSLQASADKYQCFNCGTCWQVSRSRLCRPYRLQTALG